METGGGREKAEGKEEFAGDLEGGVGAVGEVTVGELILKRSSAAAGAWLRGRDRGAMMWREATIGLVGVLSSSSSSSGKGTLDDADEEALETLILDSLDCVLVPDCPRSMRREGGMGGTSREPCFVPAARPKLNHLRNEGPFSTGVVDPGRSSRGREAIWSGESEGGDPFSWPSEPPSPSARSRSSSALLNAPPSPSPSLPLRSSSARRTTSSSALARALRSSATILFASSNSSTLRLSNSPISSSLVCSNSAHLPSSSLVVISSAPFACCNLLTVPRSSVTSPCSPHVSDVLGLSPVGLLETLVVLGVSLRLLLGKRPKKPGLGGAGSNSSSPRPTRVVLGGRSEWEVVARGRGAEDWECRRRVSSRNSVCVSARVRLDWAILSEAASSSCVESWRACTPD